MDRTPRLQPTTVTLTLSGCSATDSSDLAVGWLRRIQGVRNIYQSNPTTRTNAMYPSTPIHPLIDAHHSHPIQSTRTPCTQSQSRIPPFP